MEKNKMDKKTFKDKYDAFKPTSERRFDKSKCNEILEKWKEYIRLIENGFPIDSWLKNEDGYLPEFLEADTSIFGRSRIGNYNHIMIYQFTGTDESRKNMYIDRYENINSYDKKDIEPDYINHIQKLLMYIVSAKTLNDVFAVEKNVEYVNFSNKQILRKITILMSLLGDCEYYNQFMWFYNDNSLEKLADIMNVDIDSCETFLSKNHAIYKQAKEWSDLSPKASIKEINKLCMFLLELSAENKDDKQQIVSGENTMDTLEKGKSTVPLNTILYGPPGTGKTYSTVNYAVAIIDNKSIQEIEEQDYDKVLDRYKKYKTGGLIESTTFHQSYGYEEFIEGIKPIVDSDKNEIGYTIENGIFKEFCENANSVNIKTEEFEVPSDAVIWKITIRDCVREDCFDNGRVRINWEMYSEGARSFVKGIKKGDIILSTNGSRKTISGIAVATEDDAYELGCENDSTTRNVKWLVKGESIDILSINNGKMLHRMTVARVPFMKISDILKITQKYNSELKGNNTNNNKRHVFIIDEINRGNISKIFGELITLIEDTKRAGEKEAASAILPYSGVEFSVPSNVYILGTMNTADRSIALMDTALRRRFQFVEMMPDVNVLRKIGADKVDDLDVAKMLEKINDRITFLYDREHTIGHAFFTKLKDDPTIENLASIFKKSIIPLLQEYFYEDYQKIQLVLGDNDKSDSKYKFIKDEEVKVREIFKGNVKDDMDLPEKKYYINEEAFKYINSYKEII